LKTFGVYRRVFGFIFFSPCGFKKGYRLNRSRARRKITPRPVDNSAGKT